MHTLTCSPKNPYNDIVLTSMEENINECPDIVTLAEADREAYRTLFSSVLVSYETLKVGEGIGQGIGICGNTMEIKLIIIILLGAFGKVYRGQLLKSASESPTEVAVKTIKS